MSNDDSDEDYDEIHQYKDLCKLLDHLSMVSLHMINNSILDGSINNDEGLAHMINYHAKPEEENILLALQLEKKDSYDVLFDYLNHYRAVDVSDNSNPLLEDFITYCDEKANHIKNKEGGNPDEPNVD